MNTIYYYPLLLISLLPFACVHAQHLSVNPVVNKIEKHLLHRLSSTNPNGEYPRSYKVGQSVITVNSSDWTSGFFPGMLWYMYEYTQNPYWRNQAEQWIAGLEKEKNNRTTHDIGFILYCSFGNGYRLTKNPYYAEVLVEGAKSLASRYNSKIGCIRSWDHGPWKYPVIIDNMMNLELLYWATKFTGDSTFYLMAKSHADKTMKNHYRPDGSSYHVVDYDIKSGSVISRTTAQGLSNKSSWARGQAWGLYGFTTAYRETGEKKYLDHALKIAEYIIRNLPSDKIPYWDFSVTKKEDKYRDASGAAIFASALLELSKYTDVLKNELVTIAEEILRALSSSSFLAGENTNGNFVLLHSVGNKPGNSDVDVPIIYADYYFLEGLIRFNDLSKK